MLYDLPNWFAYALVYVFGAITVGVFSKKQFDVVSEAHAVEIPEILKGYPVSYLAGSGSYSRGVALYVAIYQFVYLLLCSSSVILDLAVGSLGLGSVDIVGFSGVVDGKSYGTALNVAIPLFVSSLILTFANVSPVSEVDSLFRSFAHGAAGVPGNLHAAMEAVDKFPFENFPDDGTSASARTISQEIQKIATDHSAKQEVIKSLLQSILQTYTLRPWLTGTADRNLWAQSFEARLGQLVEGLKFKVDGLEARLKSLKQGDNDVRRQTDWMDLADEAKVLSEDTKAVFALFATNNPSARPNSELVDCEVMSDLLAKTRGNREYRAIAPLHEVAFKALIFMAVVISATRVGFGILGALPSEGSWVTKFHTVWTATNWGEFFAHRKERILLDLLFYVAMFYVLFAATLGLRANSIRNNSWIFYSKKSGYHKKYFGILFVVVVVVLSPVYILVTAMSYVVPQIDWSDFSLVWSAGRLALQPEVLLQNLDILLVSAVFCWMLMSFSDLADQVGKPENWKVDAGKVVGGLFFALIFLKGDQLIRSLEYSFFDFFAYFTLQLMMPIALATICFNLYVTAVLLSKNKISGG